MGEVPQARAVSVRARRAGGKTWCAVTLSRAVQELCVVTLDSDRLAVLELGPVPPPPPDWPPRFGQFWDQEDLLEAKEDEMVEQHMGHYPVDAHGYHSTNIASHDWTKERESGDSRIYLGVTVQGAVHHGSTVRIFDSRGAWWTEGALAWRLLRKRMRTRSQTSRLWSQPHSMAYQPHLQLSSMVVRGRDSQILEVGVSGGGIHVVSISLKMPRFGTYL